MINLRTTALVLTIALLAFSSRMSLAEHQMGDEHTANTYTPSAGAMILDGLVYRPLSLAGTAVGLGVFIVTLPFSALGGNVEQAGETLVVEPARATFGECLGCLPGHYNQR
ncbi:MAG: multidrug transporter [Gammaproteobacteria bacterium]|nr:multidrug transporter [Gammaproteobacteria bacterium]